MGLLGKRRQLFELQDFPWFPGSIRDGVTDYLRFTIDLLNIYGPAETVLLDLFQRTGSRELVDLCSGGAGPHLLLRERLSHVTGGTVRVTLTDKFPNLEAYRALASRTGGTVAHAAHSVDARAVPADYKGVRTLFTALHHFNDQDARAILKDAADKGRPIAVFEFMERHPWTLLNVMAAPFLMPFLMPFLWPWKFSRFFWTYVLPLIPLTALWDATASVFRTRDVAEMEALVAGLGGSSYRWRAGRLRTVLGMHVLYLTGHPEDKT